MIAHTVCMSGGQYLTAVFPAVKMHFIYTVYDYTYSIYVRGTVSDSIVFMMGNLGLTGLKSQDLVVMGRQIISIVNYDLIWWLIQKCIILF